MADRNNSKHSRLEPRHTTIRQLDCPQSRQATGLPQAGKHCFEVQEHSNIALRPLPRNTASRDVYLNRRIAPRSGTNNHLSISGVRIPEYEIIFSRITPSLVVACYSDDRNRITPKRVGLQHPCPKCQFQWHHARQCPFDPIMFENLKRDTNLADLPFKTRSSISTTSVSIASNAIAASTEQFTITRKYLAAKSSGYTAAKSSQCTAETKRTARHRAILLLVC